MKKTYISPRVEIIQYVSNLSLLAVSTYDGMIVYGGKDTAGTLDPDSKFDEPQRLKDDDYDELDDLW